MTQSKQEAYLREIAYSLPERALGNDELAHEYGGWTSEKIAEKTGILNRYVANQECASDLAETAARRLFSISPLKAEKVDFIILATQSPDYYLPTTACILQDKLGIPTSAGAFDFNLGCSAYIYGMAMAKGLICAGIARDILLLTAETYSKYINPLDKSTRTLFGDGASASWVSNQGDWLIGEFDLGTDGSGAESLIVPAGGARMPKTAETAIERQDEKGYTRSQDNLFMNGEDILNFTIKRVPKSVQTALERNGLTPKDIDIFLFHQANKFMLEYLRRKINIPKEKFVVDIAQFGNTVSSTIPIAFSRLDVKDSQSKILLCGFGVGLSWGSVVLRRDCK